VAAVEWSDGAPIYRQLKERVVAMLLDGVLKPGDALPSVRQVAAEYQLNPITVSRAYQELADDQLVEKRRGLGMYVTEGAAKKVEGQRARPLPPRGMAAGAGTHPAAGAGPAGTARPEGQVGDEMSAAMDRSVITARGLRKVYKNKAALAGTDFEIRAGRIVGLIGPNGAGKTTALKAILGLVPFDGELKVLGKDPRTQRDELMNEVCFIADVAVLPRWIKVKDAIEFVAGVHPRFDAAKCRRFLHGTQLKPTTCASARCPRA
jgi:DNA-binding transcriptional regulator YhcF (GntR family)